MGPSKNEFLVFISNVRYTYVTCTLNVRYVLLQWVVLSGGTIFYLLLTFCSALSWICIRNGCLIEVKGKRQHFLCTKYELYNGHVTIPNYITLDLFCDHLFRQGTRWSMSQHQQYSLSRHEICCRKSMFIASNIKTLIFTTIWAFLTIRTGHLSWTRFYMFLYILTTNQLTHSKQCVCVRNLLED